MLSPLPSAIAAVLHVCPDGSGEYPHLRAAVEAAPCGDEIELCAGVFDGLDNLDIEVGAKNLAFRSPSGRDPTIIDATIVGGEYGEPMPHYCFGLAAGTTTRIEAITMANALHGRWEGEGDGGAIRAAGASLTLVDCRIEGALHKNGASRGAGVFVGGGFLRAIGCEFIRNRAGTYGGAISADDGRVEIERCHFEGNGACSYGGVAVVGDGTMIACTFDAGGAMFCDYTSGNLLLVRGSARVLNCRFNHGWNADSGGLLTGPGSDVVVEGCSFQGCSADVFGGAAFLHGNVTVRNTAFRGSYGAWQGGSDLILRGEGAIGVLHVLPHRFAALQCHDGRALRDARRVRDRGPLHIPPMSLPSHVRRRGRSHARPAEGANGNRPADPLFCDAAAGDLGLQSGSPRAPQTTRACGVIGAIGVSCGSLAVEEASWGAIGGGGARLATKRVRLPRTEPLGGALLKKEGEVLAVVRGFLAER